MAKNNLVDGLIIYEEALNGKCEDCIMGRQSNCPLNGETDKTLDPLELILFDLWGLGRKLMQLCLDAMMYVGVAMKTMVTVTQLCKTERQL